MEVKAGFEHGTVWGQVIRIGLLGLCALGLSAGVFAQGKGLYAAGKAHYFLSNGGTLTYQRGTIDENCNLWQLYWHQEKSHTWSGLNIPASGGIGACYFGGKAYCFFSTTDNGGELRYVTVDASSGSAHGPTTITSGSTALPHGVGAAVAGGRLYVFTAMAVLSSGDGTNFAVTATIAGTSPALIYDAVTFYPLGDEGETILVVLKSGDSGKVGSTLYTPGSSSFASPTQLPYPWTEEFLGGNLVLGTYKGVGILRPDSSSMSLSNPPGANVPCVQFYALRKSSKDSYGDLTGHPVRFEYNLVTRAWSASDLSGLFLYGGNYYHLFVMPWWEGPTPAPYNVLSLLHCPWAVGDDGLDVENSIWTYSDWMQPQHNDPVYGWNGLPTSTAGAGGTSDKDKMLRSLWSLVGVVLGAPPFAFNRQDACGFSPISAVTYGTEQSWGMTSTQTTSHKVSISSENTIKAGFAEFSLDLTYAHGWSSSHGSSHSVTVSTYHNFDQCNEDPNIAGTSGWAIFSAPLFLTQWYKLHAWDGTYLNQDLYATTLGGSVLQSEDFDLTDPSQGQVTGLLQGMPAYPASKDCGDWASVQDWNSGGSGGADWVVIFGNESNPPVGILNIAGSTTQTYVTSDTKFSTQSETNSFSVEAGATFELFNGFESEVKVGYDTEYETSTEIEDTISTTVSCSLLMVRPDCTLSGDYVKGMTVQPFWLQAKTNQAPWIPTGYDGNLPWCITWDVSGITTCSGATSGLSAPPSTALGSIRLGGDQEKDKYELAGGQLTWVDADGIETPIPMTADDFHPSNGASVSLSGHVFAAADSNGKWTRKGDVWSFKAGQGAKPDSFTLDLDFAGKTWALDASSKTLDQEIKTANGAVRVQLDVAGLYRFTHWLDHHVKASWSHSEKKASWEPYGVHEIKGDYDSQTGAGHLTLKGHVPKNVKTFGDLVLRINGVPVAIPLLSQPGFLEDLDRGRTAKYEAEGLSFSVDFATGKWKAEIEGDKFQAAMAPEGGAVRVQASVGCAPVSDQTLVLQKHTTDLRFDA